MSIFIYFGNNENCYMTLLYRNRLRRMLNWSCIPHYFANALQKSVERGKNCFYATFFMKLFTYTHTYM